jgi:2-oxo-3-hexenedioate decarboxylase/2-keto-4-pentenoate hydratase
VKPQDIIGVTGRQTLNGKSIGEGKSEDPFATLAWLANLLAERNRDLKAGMVVITGSLIPTFSIQAGDRCVFTVDGLGEAIMDVT